MTIIEKTLDSDGILTITLNRPEKLNALNQEVLHALQEIFTHAKDNPKVKGLIITGAGKAFCAGADIGRGAQADRPGDFGHDVGHDVAIEVAGHHHVKVLRPCRQPGCTDIDDPVVIGNFWVFCCNFIEDLSEQTIGLLHDVVFGKASDFLAAIKLGIFKCIANDFFTTWAADELQTLHHFIGLLVFDACI